MWLQTFLIKSYCTLFPFIVFIELSAYFYAVICYFIVFTVKYWWKTQNCSYNSYGTGVLCSSVLNFAMLRFPTRTLLAKIYSKKFLILRFIKHFFVFQSCFYSTFEFVVWCVFDRQASVVAVSSSVSYASAEECEFDRLMPLNYETKFYLANFIDSLQREHCKMCTHDCLVYYLG